MVWQVGTIPKKGLEMRLWFLSCFCLAFSCSVLANEFEVGDCVVFREGGDGRVFKAPTYWWKGRVVSLTTERREAGLCPVIAKPRSSFTREERVRLARAMPCVQREADVREILVRRGQIEIVSWETPWSNQHGTAGLLFRGMFLDSALVQGGIVEVDVDWLESCDVMR